MICSLPGKHFSATFGMYSGYAQSTQVSTLNPFQPPVKYRLLLFFRDF